MMLLHPLLQLSKYSLLKLQMVFPQSNKLVTHEMRVEQSLSNFIDKE